MDKRLLDQCRNEQERADMKAIWAASHPVRTQLVRVLEKELEASYTEMSKKDNYFMPAWSEYQASKIAEQKTLRSLINTLKGD